MEDCCPRSLSDSHVETASATSATSGDLEGASDGLRSDAGRQYHSVCLYVSHGSSRRVLCD